MHSRDWIPSFKSPLKKELEEFVKFKRTQGYKYGEPICYRLKELDNYLDSLNQECPHIDQEVYDNWIKLCKGKGTTKGKYHIAISTFCEYLRMTGKEGFIQPDSDNLKYKSNFIPYIFSDEEIATMFKINIAGINQHPKGINQKTFFILICLYYSCGLRKTEALDLKYSNFNQEEKTITIMNGKNNVSRIIPLSDSMYDQLLSYILITKSLSKNPFIFINNQGEKYSEYTLYKSFHQLLKEAQIPIRYDGKRQRIHDFRHTFCIKAMKQMEQKGFDLYTSLPILSVYLGHKHITETEYYLRLIEKESDNVSKKATEYMSTLYGKKGDFYEK